MGSDPLAIVPHEPVSVPGGGPQPQPAARFWVNQIVPANISSPRLAADYAAVPLWIRTGWKREDSTAVLAAVSDGSSPCNIGAVAAAIDAVCPLRGAIVPRPRKRLAALLAYFGGGAHHGSGTVIRSIGFHGVASGVDGSHSWQWVRTAIRYCHSASVHSSFTESHTLSKSTTSRPMNAARNGDRVPTMPLSGKSGSTTVSTQTMQAGTRVWPPFTARNSHQPGFGSFGSTPTRERAQSSRRSSRMRGIGFLLARWSLRGWAAASRRSPVADHFGLLDVPVGRRRRAAIEGEPHRHTGVRFGVKEPREYGTMMLWRLVLQNGFRSISVDTT